MLKNPAFSLAAIILLVFSSFRPSEGQLEKMNLCQSVNHISKALADGNLSIILGEETGTEDGITIYDSKVDVIGLEDEFIVDSDTETVFFATYVNESASKLKAKFTELRNQLSKCIGKSYETDKLEDIETASFKMSDKVTVELTIYLEDKEIDLNIDIIKE